MQRTTFRRVVRSLMEQLLLTHLDTWNPLKSQIFRWTPKHDSKFLQKIKQITMIGYCCFPQKKTWVYFLIPTKRIRQTPYPDVMGLSQVNTWFGPLRFKKSRLPICVCHLGGSAYNKALCLKRRLLPCHFKHTCNDNLPVPSSQQVLT